MWHLWCACFQEINFLKNQDVQDFFHIIFKILIYSLTISYLHICYIYIYITLWSHSSLPPYSLYPSPLTFSPLSIFIQFCFDFFFNSLSLLSCLYEHECEQVGLSDVTTTLKTMTPCPSAAINCQWLPGKGEGPRSPSPIHHQMLTALVLCWPFQYTYSFPRS